MREEHLRLGLRWQPFHPRLTSRRIAEVNEADYVLLPSQFVARSFLAKGFSADRLLRVPYPTQKIAGVLASAPAVSKKTDVFRVLYVGSISVRKGLRYLVEAFRQFRHPKKELWIVGGAASQTGLENVSLPDGIKFLGVLKGNDLQAAYTGATVFCLPSVEDGFGLVLNEAISYGLPVIATENTGIDDLLLDGKGGMVVPIRDAAAIAAFLNRLADDDDFLASQRRDALAAAARLADPSRSRATLSGALIDTFQQHHAEVHEPG